VCIFFDKGNILISQRYQLYPASATIKYPKDIKDAHLKKIKRKRLGQFFVAAAHESYKNSPKATPLRKKQCTSAYVYISD
jgi:hypothetical protein